jgi:hypothetical protein
MPLCVLWVELESVNGYYALDKQKQPIPQPLVNGARAVSTWNYQTSATNNNWQSVCWCPELFLAVTCASSGVGNRIMTSSNLISWTSRTSASDLLWQCVAYGGPVGSKKLVAVSSGGGLVQTSTDGTTWTSNAVASQAWNGVVYSPELNLWVAVSTSGTNKVMYAVDPTSTWTLVSSGVAPGAFWLSVCWGSGQAQKFVAVSNSGSNKIMYSSTGTSDWTGIASPDESASWRSVCFSPQLNLYCAIADSATTYRCMVSNDGVTWVGVNIASNPYRTITWCAEIGLFVAMASNSKVANSADGYNWYYSNTQVNQWESVAWCPQLSQCVAVSSDGTTNRVITTCLRGRQPTQYNLYDNAPYNSVNEANGDWTIQGASFTSPNQNVLLGSTLGDTTIQANQSGAGGVINLLGGTGMISASAGTATGTYLQLRINGTPYKISLYNL